MRTPPEREGFSLPALLLMALATLSAMLLCVCLGSVAVPLRETLAALFGGAHNAIIGVRLPRVLCAALCGAALALSGAAMQGLLCNPLADGSTLGVSSGASLGAVLSLAFGISVPGLPQGGSTPMAVLFAFISLMAVLTLAYRMDGSLATNTIILIGVIFSMFISSLINLVITFAGERVKNITHWTLGAFSGATYGDAALLTAALALFGGVLLALPRELNAFAAGEDSARHIGVDVRRVKPLVLVCVSALVGVCVSVAGTIGFAGLVVPHIVRMLCGANHRRLLPASLFFGAVFLLLCDLAARLLLSPRELPIGVVTSFIGAIFFVYIFYLSRRSA